MKRFTTRLLLAMLALSFLASLAPMRATAAGYRIVIDGRAVDGVQAEMRNGQITVAVRNFVEALGGHVVWKDADQQILSELGDSQLALWIGSSIAYQDGQRLSVPVSPYFRNGKTMAPAWWLATRFDTKVSFDGTTLSVTTGSTQSGQGTFDFLKDPDLFFPYSKSAPYQKYYDTWGDGRTYQGRNFGHEGTDILAPTGTPIIAVSSGKIVRYGWNTLGGYRLTIELDEYPGWRFYYAHMDRYANGLYLGARVKAGQVIGYTGSTGEGPERTQGKFVPHLHFGIYRPDGKAVNPYPYLKLWERHKVQW
ncbi:MAG TPA: peptidoglycan DD-metalloendopeptidase family protein [Symbiobacteriaceae bacterium]|nr:peptidoglycan DD-metalloendopeptidase family protein [Symbiobacteriaceae bacterium]